MSVAITNRPTGDGAAAGSSRPLRRGRLSAGLLLILAAALAVARFTGGDTLRPPASTGTAPVSSAQRWLATHDYRLIAELRGVRTRNVTAVRRGDVVGGDVQTMQAEEQIDYYRFRIRAGEVQTTSTGALATAHWTRATSAQRTLVTHVTDPRWILAPFHSPAQLRDLGQSGDAEMYTTPRGDRLFTAHAQPLRVITHDLKAGRDRTFQIDALQSSRTR